MKPIGSEKIQDVDQRLARILEIAGVSKDSINENKPLIGHLGNLLHEAVAADGTEYGIVQEENTFISKEKLKMDTNTFLGYKIFMSILTDHMLTLLNT